MKRLLFVAYALAGSACAPSQLADAESAASKASARRDTICAFVEVWAPDLPELSDARQLCQAGADLKAIAAAYAGCAR